MNRRWGIAGLLALGVVVGYLDRIALSVATGPIRQEFGLDEFQMGWVLSAYLWCYALIQLPIGIMLDRFGVTSLMRGSIALWSIATILTAHVPGLQTLIAVRVLLGIAEAPSFPACAKIVSAWFPRQERGRATSLFDGAGKFSSVIGTPLIAGLVTWGGWRAGFWGCGMFSLVYLGLFWAFYRDPDHDPWVSLDEKQWIAAGGADTRPSPPVPLAWLLRQRRVWGLTLGFAASSYSFYLLLVWLPGYMQEELGLSVLKTGIWGSVPWMVATASDLLVGGWLVDHLISRGYDSTRVRKSLIVLGLTLGLAVAGPAFTRDPRWAVFWISVALGGLASMGSIAWSLPGLVAPEGSVALVGSLMNCASNLMGIVSPIATGYLVGKSHRFGPAFGFSALLLALGIVCYVVLLDRVERLEYP